MMKQLPALRIETIGPQVHNEYQWYTRGVADTLNIDHLDDMYHNLEEVADAAATEVCKSFTRIVRSPGLSPYPRDIDEIFPYWQFVNNEFPPDKKKDWWGTDTSRATILALGDMISQPLTYTAASAVLGIAYGTVARHAHLGYIERHQDGGLAARSVRHNLLRRLSV